MSDVASYFLGLPAWAFPGWNKRYFTDKASRLASYARVFNAVEGNTTFYQVPDRDTVKRWRDAVGDVDFRFCFKLPREVTHEQKAHGRMLERFLDAIEPLDKRLGPLLVQFPATFGPADLEISAAWLRDLGERRRYVIEVRHPAFFDEPDLLEPVFESAAGRVVLDSRPLYEGDRSHPDVLAALHRKPDVPVDPELPGDAAFVRLILHPDLDSNRRYVDEWAGHVAGYVRRGVETYMMIHCPNNLHCPPLALEFHEALCNRLDGLGPLPAWPVPEQLSLV
jgi:uncharacterized protein YecE (DUF72 family)